MSNRRAVDEFEVRARNFVQPTSRCFLPTHIYTIDIVAFSRKVYWIFCAWASVTGKRTLYRIFIRANVIPKRTFFREIIQAPEIECWLARLQRVPIRNSILLQLHVPLYFSESWCGWWNILSFFFFVFFFFRLEKLAIMLCPKPCV